MPKNIPIALKSHLSQEATTYCFLYKLVCRDGLSFGGTSLDAALTYDDGNGEVVYQADNGFGMSAVEYTADASVDNAKVSAWTTVGGFTEAEVRAGLFDGAKLFVYRVNYMSLSQGHEIVATGRVGEVTINAGRFAMEFRSLKQFLRQPISQLETLTCPARFGSKPIGTNDGSFEEERPCGKDFVWEEYEVTAVDPIEPDRVFTSSAMTEADGFYDFGVVEILTGANAGIQVEVESFSAKTFELSFHLHYDMAPGDLYRARRDCNKVHNDADHGCVSHYGADWSLKFRGFPDIPVADGGAGLIPGAQINRA